MFPNRVFHNVIATALTVLCAAWLPKVSFAAGASVERMYVLQCGHSVTSDVSANWSPGVDIGVSREFSDNCYLIRHGDRWLLWDTGMSDTIADKPEGVVVAGGLLRLFVRQRLNAQLQSLGLAPTDITDLAISHFHSDHAGNANLFTRATVYVQKTEWSAAFGPDAAKSGYSPALYGGLASNPRQELSGDHDVFGDGSVTILSTPGHTAGHQSLLVRLPRRGAIILSGDMVHFEENWRHRRIPARNFDAGQTAASMERIAEIMRTHNAQLWINHDKSQSDGIPKAPQAME